MLQDEIFDMEGQSTFIKLSRVLPDYNQKDSIWSQCIILSQNVVFEASQG